MHMDMICFTLIDPHGWGVYPLLTDLTESLSGYCILFAGDFDIKLWYNQWTNNDISGTEIC